MRPDLNALLKDDGQAAVVAELARATEPPRDAGAHSRTGANGVEPTITPEPLTDTGNGERFARLLRDRARYVEEIGWFWWDGRRWNRDQRDLIPEHMTKAVIDELWNEFQRIGAAVSQPGASRREHEQQFNRLMAFWKSSSSLGGRRAMLGCARSEPGMHVRADQLDTDPWALNCQNGVVDLRSGKLLPHDASRLITKVAPVAYRADAPRERLERFLREVFDENQELVAFVKRLMGYAITGVIREHLFPVFHGTGRNGKGTFLEAIRGALGDGYSCEIGTEVLLHKGKLDNADQETIKKLHGARAVFSHETNRGRRLNEAMVKYLTGGDRITVCAKYEKEFSFVPTHQLFLVTNSPPKIEGRGPAIWGRIRKVPFNACFEKSADVALGEKLALEREGIVAWLVEGCLEWIANGHRVGEPDAVTAATADYREREDVGGQFIEDRCEIDPAIRRVGKTSFYWTKTADLMAAFEGWGRDAGVELPGAKGRGAGVVYDVLQEALEDKGCVRHARFSGKRGWAGVRLRDVDADDRPEDWRDR